MKSVFAFGVSFVGAALVVASLSACSSKTAATTPPAPDYGPQLKCDPTLCLAGNTCLQGDGELKCRRACSSNTDAATNCPAGATCVAGSTPSTIPAACARATDAVSQPLCAPFGTGGGVRLHAFTCDDANTPKNCVASGTANVWCCSEAAAETYAQPFCVKLLAAITPGPKQWGATCNPAGGLDANPDCDSAQGFFCHGTTPADATAYCTRYSCDSDRECAPEFYCGTINVAPNVTTTKPSLHQTTTACLRREYCSPCAADFDCPLYNNQKQHCVADAMGNGFCGPECTTSKNCAYDSKCVDTGIGVHTCYPRAGVCVGDGSLCSPCRNDADCGADGVCTGGQYTTEKFCAKKSAIACAKGAKMCPPSAAPMAQIGCTTVDGDIPANYCVGLYDFGLADANGQPTDLGCWTPAR